jgi:lipase chaperone LimK
MVGAIGERLQGAAASRAVDLLDRYLAYRDAARRLGAEDDLAARAAELKQLRRRYFDPADAEKLFGRQERDEAVAVEKRRVALDPSVPAAERAVRIAALERALPEAEQAARAAAMGPLLEREIEDAMRARGATDGDIQQRRIDALGPEVAARLKALDDARAAWTERLRAFQVERDAIARAYPDPATRDAMVQKLLEDSFTPPERLRVRAADEIAAAR